MEPPCPLISWVNPLPRRFINRTTFFCNAWIAWMRLLPAVWSKTILLSFLYFHWLFPLLARETSSGNCSIYKSTRERVDSSGLYGRWRLHLMGSWVYLIGILVNGNYVSLNQTVFSKTCFCTFLNFDLFLTVHAVTLTWKSHHQSLKWTLTEMFPVKSSFRKKKWNLFQEYLKCVCRALKSHAL